MTVQRYIQVESCLPRVMSVVKVRGSVDSTKIKQFDTTDNGIVIGDSVSEFEGILGGQRRRKQDSTS